MTFETQFNELKALYDTGISLSSAAIQLGIKPNTAYNWFKKAEISVEYRRTNSEGGTGKLQHTCDECGSQYTATHSKSRFCSRTCTNKWQRINTPKHQPIICPCGKTVVPEGRTYNYTKKYCSDACRREYMINGMQKDPANYHTFNCLNCDKEVTRRRSFNHGSAKYCSNTCAQRHTKVKHHIVLKDDDVVLDSTWEALVWGMLKVAKIPVERFDRKYGVQWGTDNSWYAPDFWLPTMQWRTDRVGCAIEVKGHEDEEDQAKWSAFRASGRDLVILDDYRILSIAVKNIHSSIRIACGYDNPSN